MSTKSREVIWGSRIMGAKIRAKAAREEAAKAIRAADRAEAEAWSVRMEGYGGAAQPSPTIAQCLNGGLRMVGKSNADAARQGRALPRACATTARYADLEAGSILAMSIVRDTALSTAGAFDQADRVA
jgi:hypothetical protein